MWALSLARAWVCVHCRLEGTEMDDRVVNGIISTCAPYTSSGGDGISITAMPFDESARVSRLSVFIIISQVHIRFAIFVGCIFPSFYAICLCEKTLYTQPMLQSWRQPGSIAISGRQQQPSTMDASHAKKVGMSCSPPSHKICVFFHFFFFHFDSFGHGQKSFSLAALRIYFIYTYTQTHAMWVSEWVTAWHGLADWLWLLGWCARYRCHSDRKKIILFFSSLVFWRVSASTRTSVCDFHTPRVRVRVAQLRREVERHRKTVWTNKNEKWKEKYENFRS